MFAFSLDFSLSQIIFVLGFGLVGSVVPTPGGSAGAYHAAAAAKGLDFLGLDPNLAASIAIVYHLIAFGPPFVIGLFYLVRDDISLGQLREMIASESAERQGDKETGRQGDGETERERQEDKEKGSRKARGREFFISLSPSLLVSPSLLPRGSFGLES